MTWGRGLKNRFSHFRDSIFLSAILLEEWNHCAVTKAIFILFFENKQSWLNWMLQSNCMKPLLEIYTANNERKKSDNLFLWIKMTCDWIDLFSAVPVVSGASSSVVNSTTVLPSGNYMTNAAVYTLFCLCKKKKKKNIYIYIYICLQNSRIILINESLKEKTAIVPRDLSVNKFDVIWVAAKLALICTSRAPWIFWYNFIVTVLRIKSCGILHVDNFSASSQECTFFV